MGARPPGSIRPYPPVASEKTQQRWISEKPFPPDFHLVQHAESGQRLQINGCGLALGDPCFDKVADSV
jgi:hypothetical protein